MARPVWSAGKSGFRKPGRSFTPWAVAAGLPKGVSIQFLLQTRAGDILAGTTYGAYRLARGAARFELLRLSGPDERPPAIVSIFEPVPGTLVFSARDGQLFFRRGGQVRLARQAAPLAESPAFFMGVMDGQLWIAGLQGISRTPLPAIEHLLTGKLPELPSITVLGTPHSYHGIDQGGCCNGLGTSRGVLRDGVLYAPGRDSVYSHRPVDMQANTVPPIAVIERVSVGRHGYDIDAAPRGELEKGARDLEFQFTMLSLRDPDHNTLRYRLAGYDDKWYEPSRGEHGVRYTNLPPGHYRFEVDGRNASGTPAAAAVTYAFSIPPFAHETWWFPALMALLALALVTLAVRWFARGMARRQQELEQLVYTRTRELEAANAELERTAVTDALTGLHNRRQLLHWMPSDMAHYRKRVIPPDATDQRVLFCILDIDHFKSFNDRYGNAAGDRLLQSFARLLKRNLHAGDHLVRWGGEEFVMVLRPMPRVAVTPSLDRMLDAITQARHELAKGVEVAVTCSIGAVEYPSVTDDWEELIALADTAQYLVKKSGRNGWALLRFADDATVDLCALRTDIQACILCGDVQVIGSPRVPGASASRGSDPSPVGGML